MVEWNWLSQVDSILMSILLALVSVFLVMSTSAKESSCSSLLSILSGLVVGLYSICGVGVCSTICIVLVLVLLLNWWIKWDWSVCDHTTC